MIGVKKLFTLPKATPNYIIYLETGRYLMHDFVFRYILKVLNYADHLLPKVLAISVIENKVVWYLKWVNLAEGYGCEISEGVNLIEEWRGQMSNLRECIVRDFREKCRLRASKSQWHALYRHLTQDKKYFKKYLSRSEMSIIFKTRGNCGI